MSMPPPSGFPHAGLPWRLPSLAPWLSQPLSHQEPAAGIPGSDHRLLPTVMGMAPLPAAAAPHGSPYSMEDDNPHKYFISGETPGDAALSPLRHGRGNQT